MLSHLYRTSTHDCLCYRASSVTTLRLAWSRWAKHSAITRPEALWEFTEHKPTGGFTEEKQEQTVDGFIYRRIWWYREKKTSWNTFCSVTESGNVITGFWSTRAALLRPPDQPASPNPSVGVKDEACSRTFQWQPPVRAVIINHLLRALQPLVD